MREGNAAAVRHHAAAQIQTRLTMAFAVGVAGIQVTVLAEITQAGAVGAMAGVIIGAGDGPAQATIIEQRAVYPSLPGRARLFTVGEGKCGIDPAVFLQSKRDGNAQCDAIVVMGEVATRILIVQTIVYVMDSAVKARLQRDIAS